MAPFCATTFLAYSKLSMYYSLSQLFEFPSHVNILLRKPTIIRSKSPAAFGGGAPYGRPYGVLM